MASSTQPCQLQTDSLDGKARTVSPSPGRFSATNLHRVHVRTGDQTPLAYKAKFQTIKEETKVVKSHCVSRYAAFTRSWVHCPNVWQFNNTPLQLCYCLLWRTLQVSLTFTYRKQHRHRKPSKENMHSRRFFQNTG